jgi:hypothetical protein
VPELVRMNIWVVPRLMRPALQHLVQPRTGHRPPVPGSRPQRRRPRQPVRAPHPQVRHHRPRRSPRQWHDSPVRALAPALEWHDTDKRLCDQIGGQTGHWSATGSARSAACPRSASG